MDSAQVSSRKPKLWMKLDEARGAPGDSSGNSLSVTLNGTPTAYQVSTSKGPGIDLGGDADIEVAHNAVFETDHGIARDNASMTWVYSEVTLSGQFMVNAFTAGEDTYLFGKSGDPAAWANSLNVWVKRDDDDATTGTLRVVARMPWLRVVLASKTGEITIGTEFHVTVTLGREGLWATLNGRMLNNGEKDPRHWYGWDHRVRGLRDNEAPIGSAQGGFNAGAIRIGKSSTGSRANITVAQFAVFVTGTYANRLDLADCQALAGASGAALGHPLFDNSTQAVALGASLKTLQLAIDTCSDAGGGTVTLAAGTYSYSDHIVLKDKVRLKGAGIGSTKISLTGAATIGTGVIRKRPEDSVVPTLTSYDFPGALTRGQTSITATNTLTDDTLTDDAILIVVAVTPLMRLYIPSGTLPKQGDEVNCAEFIPVHTRTGSVFNLEGGLFFDYPKADQQAIRGFDPLLKDCEITDMTIDGNLNSGEDHGVAHFVGARRVFLRRLKITDNTAYGDNGEPATAEAPEVPPVEPPINKLFNGLNMYGCVDCAVEDVECNLTSTFGDYRQLKGSHPYASQYLGGRNIVVMRGYVHSNDWTGLDIGADNFDMGWKSDANERWFVPTLRMEAVDVKGTSRWHHPAFGGHTSAACRWIGCETMTGGGFGADGWQHEHFDCISHKPPVPGFPAPKRPVGTVDAGKTKQHDGDYGLSDRGECYACRVTLEGSPGRWFEGIDRESVYVLVTKPEGNVSGKNGPNTDPDQVVGCRYVSCTKPLPPQT